MDTSSLRASIIGLGLLAAASLFAGCQQQKNLFADDDAATKSRLRYFGDESARETTESRKQAAQFGFGFPTGGGGQE